MKPLSCQSLSCLLLVLSLSACAPMDPDAPAVTALTGAQLGLDAEAAAAALPQDRWWTRYHDAQLDSLIDTALQDNPGLQGALARVRAAQAAAQGARAVQWPQVNAHYHLTRERLSENYIYPPPLGGSAQTDTALNLQLNFDLDLWGRLAALHEAAQYRVQAAQADQAQARSLLVSAVAQAYFQLQNARAQSDAIARIVEKLAEVLAVTRERETHGLGTQVDVDQADSALSAARVQLGQVRNTVDLLHHRLAALLGRAPGQFPALRAQPYQALATPAPAGIPLAVLGRRADIAAARLQALAAGAEVSAARAEFLPNINLTAAIGLVALGADRLFHGGSADYAAGPVLTLPIFNAGALNARLAGQRAQRDAAIARYNDTVVGALREVADAQASIEALQEQIVHQEASLRAITSAYDIALQRYKAGLGDFIQVLMAQSEVLKQTVQTSDLHARAYVLDVQLATALGGGHDFSPAPAPEARIHSSL